MWIIAPLVLALALLVDRVFGDPRTRFHPVALLGRFIGWWGIPSKWPAWSHRGAGVILWICTAFLFTLPFSLFQVYSPWYLTLLIAPFLLKVCFAWRSLEEHTCAVVKAMNGTIGDAREKVGLLVSRETASLDREHILSAGYESMTENLVDSIVAPVFYFGFAGLAGAAVYRAANTMDAMLGYRDERERLGWFSARMDDILSYIPARITGLLLLLYFACTGSFRPAWETLCRDARKRPGFNGGIPMAIMAGGVGIKFEKPGVYSIGNGTKTLDEGGREIIRAVRVITLVFSFLVMITLLILGSLTKYSGI
jgi:cobalamin biosynthesis protein CobD